MSDELKNTMRAAMEAYEKAGVAGSEGARAMREGLARIEALEAQLAEARAQLATYETSAICEIAARNPSVMEYMHHWEGRAETAEAQLAAARAEGYAQGVRDALQEARDRTPGKHAAPLVAHVTGASIEKAILALLDTPGRIEALEAQLAKAREAALAIHEIGFECEAGPLSFCAEWWALRDALGLHLDTPAPVQPSPDAVARAALEWAAEELEG
jgi:hypothetical protein